MGYQRADVRLVALGLRSRGIFAALAVIAAALVIHLFGPALQVSAAVEPPAYGHEHGHSSLDLDTAHAPELAVELAAAGHDEETCHSVVGVTPATTALPALTSSIMSWRQVVAMAACDRGGLRPAWIGGDGGDAAADPRRSPGVQRT